MAMPEGSKLEELRELLLQLSEALSKAEVSDPAARETLDDLAARARTIVEEPPEALSEAHSHLHEGLIGAVERIEGTHPELSALIGKVANLLSGLGI